MSPIKAFYKMVGTSLPMPEEDATPEKFTDNIFRKFDKDLDGKLNLDEFMEGATSNESFWRMLKCDRSQNTLKE
jgi:Ca2+-binding EF-hand superfamily protein